MNLANPCRPISTFPLHSLPPSKPLEAYSTGTTLSDLALCVPHLPDPQYLLPSVVREIQLYSTVANPLKNISYFVQHSCYLFTLMETWLSWRKADNGVQPLSYAPHTSGSQSFLTESPKFTIKSQFFTGNSPSHNPPFQHPLQCLPYISL